jgi:hypothetical protein
MVGSGIVVAIWSSARDLSRGGGDGVVATFGGELMDMLVFGTLATAGLLTRRYAQWHKRLIVLATLGVLGAAVGRIPLVGTYANYITVALLLTLVAFDCARERPFTAPPQSAAPGCSSVSSRSPTCVQLERGSSWGAES